MNTTASKSLWRVTSFSVALAFSIVTAPSEVTGTRPLVTILTPFPGPTAPENAQYTASSGPGLDIPDNDARGIMSDITTTDVANGACSAIFDVKVDLQLNHPRVADLKITLSTASRDGSRVLRSTTLFDGSKPDANSSKRSFDADYSILDSTDCSRWRLTVTDTVASNKGTLYNWTLKRRTAFYPFDHDKAYYEKLIFGGGSPRLPVSVNDYYQNASRGKFKYSNEGLYSATYSKWPKSRTRPDADYVHAADIVYLLESEGFNFQKYDVDNDGKVSNDELAILAFDNVNRQGGANRTVVRGGGCITLAFSALQVCTKVAMVAEESNFTTVTHELSHSLGTVDLYAENCFSYHQTLMSCTVESPADPDSMRSIRLDPWHRHFLGWASYHEGGYGGYELAEEYSPAVFRNPRNPHEYFLFEYRTPSGPWDSGMASYGALIWHVQENADGSAYRGGDNNQPEGHFIYAVSLGNDFGGNIAWQPDDGLFQLHWADNSVLPISFRFRDSGAPGLSVILEASPAPADSYGPSLAIISPANLSTVTNGLGNNITFEARAIDRKYNRIRVDWFSSAEEGHMGTGVRINFAFARPATRTITAVARNSYGAMERRSITLNVVAGSPGATIFSPADGSTIQRGQPFRISGNVATPTLFALECDKLNWSIDRDPAWSAKGCSVLAQFDFTGTAVITLGAKDEFGMPATATVRINLVEPPASGPPVVAITSLPPWNILPDRPYHITGVVRDPAGGAVTYRWTVLDQKTKREIQISTAATFDWVPQTAVNPYTSIELRLYGTNSRGTTATAVQNGYVTDLPH